MKKDKDLEKLFLDYSKAVTPNGDKTLEKAKQAVIEVKAKRAKKKIVVKLISILSCVVIIFVAGLSITNLIKNITKNTGGAFPPEAESYYSASALKSKSLDKTEVEKITDISFLNSYNLVQENYYGYYFKDGNAEKANLAFIYIKAGYIDDFGRTDITLMIELTDKYYSGSKEYITMSEYYKYGKVTIKGANKYIDGEYESTLFFTNDKIKYYLDVTTPNSIGDKNIIENILK